MTSPQDPQLLEQLLHSHGAALEFYAAQWTSAPEDCVQDALIQLVRQPQLPNSLVPWLFRVVRNRAISMARSSQRRKKHESLAAERSPTRLFATKQTKAAAEEVSDALQTLSPQQREIIVARIWGKLTLGEIAEVTGSSTSSVHRQYQAGLQTLKIRLGRPCQNKSESTISPK